MNKIWLTAVEDESAKQLAMGIVVEKEHKGTIDKIKSSIKDGKITIPDEEIFKSIAQDHLKEFSDYYTRLKKMEEEAKKMKEEKPNEKN